MDHGLKRRILLDGLRLTAGDLQYLLVILLGQQVLEHGTEPAERRSRSRRSTRKSLDSRRLDGHRFQVHGIGIEYQGRFAWSSQIVDLQWPLRATNPVMKLARRLEQRIETEDELASRQSLLLPALGHQVEGLLERRLGLHLDVLG